jgi:8-oxo-dGTP diphosphatase
MTGAINTIRSIDLTNIDIGIFPARFVGCVILTQDEKIILQQRGNDWHNFPGYLATFGGKIESGESPIQALVRELNEELGAKVIPADAIHLGVITEASTGHSELIYTYFWRDDRGSITGCYEGEAVYYNNCVEALKHPKIMDDVRWILNKCQKLTLLK